MKEESGAETCSKATPQAPLRGLGPTGYDQGERIAALEEALEPFADLFGEDDDDFPDDAPVTIAFGRSTCYGVTVGDIKRAYHTLGGWERA